MARAADDDSDSDSASDAEVAYLVLVLDATITRRRQALAASPDSQGGQSSSGSLKPPLAPRPTSTELAVLNALAQTYGPAFVKEGPFTPVLNFIVERGAVVLVQRVLWGERAEDVRLAARLLTARIPFNALCGIWPEAVYGAGAGCIAGLSVSTAGAADGVGRRRARRWLSASLNAHPSRKRSPSSAVIRRRISPRCEPTCSASRPP